MKDKHRIGTCDWCEERYCLNCSDAALSEVFCSSECEKEYHEESTLEKQFGPPA